MASNYSIQVTMMLVDSDGFRLLYPNKQDPYCNEILPLDKCLPFLFLFNGGLSQSKVVMYVHRVLHV